MYIILFCAYKRDTHLDKGKMKGGGVNLAS